MGPHLVWAGVVLVLGGLGYQALRWRWRRLEELSGGLDGLVHRVAKAEGEDRFIWDAVNEHGKRLQALEAKVGRHEQIINALSAVPKAGPPVRKI